MKNSNFKDQTSDNIQQPKSKLRPFDLEERMSDFGVEIVKFCRSLKADHVTRPLISQLVRSATSIGANYAEANNGSSKKDFRNKAHIAKKEAQETKHWLKMLTPCYLEHRGEISNFWQEAHELTLILQTIINKIDAN